MSPPILVFSFRTGSIPVHYTMKIRCLVLAFVPAQALRSLFMQLLDKYTSTPTSGTWTWTHMFILRSNNMNVPSCGLLTQSSTREPRKLTLELTMWKLFFLGGRGRNTKRMEIVEHEEQYNWKWGKSTLQVHPPYVLRGQDTIGQQGMQKNTHQATYEHCGVKAVSGTTRTRRAYSKSVCPLASEKHTWHWEAVQFAHGALAMQHQNESKYCYNYNIRIHKSFYCTSLTDQLALAED